MDFAEQVAALLRQQFPGAQVDVSFAYGAKKLSGHIIWEGFDNMEQIDRQHLLWNSLRQGLDADAQRVSTILSYTPHEDQIMAA